jgi:hypothetical protein
MVIGKTVVVADLVCICSGVSRLCFAALSGANRRIESTYPNCQVAMQTIAAVGPGTFMLNQGK